MRDHQDEPGIMKIIEKIGKVFEADLTTVIRDRSKPHRRPPAKFRDEADRPFLCDRGHDALIQQR